MSRQYSFRFSRSTIGVFKIIPEILCLALVNNVEVQSGHRERVRQDLT